MIEYDIEVIKILKESEKEAKLLGSKYVSTEHIILAILKSDNTIKKHFLQRNITYDDYLSIVKESTPRTDKNTLISYTPLLKRIIISSSKNNKVKLKELVLRILDQTNSVAYSLLLIKNININELYNDIKNEEIISCGINLNKKKLDKLWIREKELNELIESLCKKNKNNVILIGEAGVGKTALVESLAQKINMKDVPKELIDKQIISINIASIVAGTKYRGEFEDKLEKIIKRFENDKYILFIDEIHTILGAGSSEGSIDAANILKPYLAREDIRCIGATTINEFNNSIKKDKALMRRFKIIHINEPNRVETEQILLNVKKYYEDFHNVRITNKSIKNIINLSSIKLPNKKEPDRSLDILDIACTKLKLKYKDDKYNELLNKKNKYLIENNFKKVIEINTKINNLYNKNRILSQDIINNCFNDLNNTNKIGFKLP